MEFKPVYPRRKHLRAGDCVQFQPYDRDENAGECPLATEITTEWHDCPLWCSAFVRKARPLKLESRPR